MIGSYEQLTLLVEKKMGVVLHDKGYLLESRLPELMREYGLATWEDVHRKLDSNADPVFEEKITEKLTTHETSFFRDASIFAAFEKQIVPEWIERHLTGGMLDPAARLSIWSAGCSTGQEAYSLAMTLFEKFPVLLGRNALLGTDISRPTIEKAREGWYTDFEIARGLPEKYRDAFFTRAEDGFRARSTLRSMVRFEKHNLIADAFPGQFDIIFCRNVSIYFTEEQRRALFARLARCLKPDGVLVLGSAESLLNFYAGAIRREYGLAQYYEINASHVTIFS